MWLKSIQAASEVSIYMADDSYEFSHASKKEEAERNETLKNNRYLKFLDENKIIYKSERIGPHHIFWDIQANKEQFEKIIN